MDNAQDRDTAPTLAARVQQLLDVAGDSKAAAARKTGLGYATIHGILSGERKAPDAGTLKKIGDAYGVSVGWLMAGEEASTLPMRDADAPEPWPEDPVRRLKHAFSHPATLIAHPEYKDPRELAKAVVKRAADEGLNSAQISELLDWSMRDPTQG